METYTDWTKTHKKWTDPFVIELRSRDVPGKVIGDQLATVYSHCVETGASPEEAFGEAGDYARSLGYTSEIKNKELLRTLRPTIGNLLLSFVFYRAVDAYDTSQNFEVNLGTLSCWIVGALVIISLPFVPYRILAGKPWVAPLLAGIGSALGIGGAVLSRNTNLPIVVSFNQPLWVLVICGLLMIVLAIFASRQLKPGEDDVVLSPLEDPTKRAQEIRGANRLAMYSAWVLPIFSFVSALLVFLF